MEVGRSRCFSTCPVRIVCSLCLGAAPYYDVSTKHVSMAGNFYLKKARAPFPCGEFGARAGCVTCGAWQKIARSRDEMPQHLNECVRNYAVRRRKSKWNDRECGPPVFHRRPVAKAKSGASGRRCASIAVPCRSRAPRPGPQICWFGRTSGRRCVPNRTTCPNGRRDSPLCDWQWG